MKMIKNITIAYSVLMAIALLVMLKVVGGIELALKNVGSYTDDELKIYKAVWDEMNNSVAVAQKTTLKYCIIFWAVVLILGYAMILLVYITQVRPVNEMKNYAAEIAKGNLDIPLPIHRANTFEGFTESFDLMREELKASKERELAAEQAKRELVAELSHDIKTPVATIQATCEVLDMIYSKKKYELENGVGDQAELENGTVKSHETETAKNDTDKKQGETGTTQSVEMNLQDVDSTLEKIGFISKKADTINQLIGNVFRATLDDMEEIRVAVEETNSRMIEGFFTNLKEYGNIILENHIPECLVYMDKLRMEQVVDNIVGNSYKYAGTDIRVSFDEVKDIPSKDGLKNNYIKVKISDNGPGVPEDELPLVIEKYYRGSDTTDKNGYGLGLYLVNWYMEKQGGGMEYYNDNGFVVELLVKKV